MAQLLGGAADHHPLNWQLQLPSLSEWEGLHRQQRLQTGSAGNQSLWREDCRYGNHTNTRLNQEEAEPQRDQYTCFQGTDLCLHGNHQSNAIKTNQQLNGGRADCCPPLRSHDHLPPTARHMDRWVLSSASRLFQHGPAHTDRGPSPLCRDDTPYSILSVMETTEPITAVFMGFQTAQDDSRSDCDGSLTAELVVIGDHEDHSGEMSTSRRPDNGWTHRPRVRRIQKKQRACCCVC